MTEDQMKSAMESMLKGGSPGGSGTFWNYYNPTKEHYMTVLEGELMEISIAYRHKFQSQEIDRWPDGNPKQMLRLHVQTEEGEYVWDVQPKSPILLESILPNCPEHNLAEAIGRMVRIETQEPPLNPQTGQPIPYSRAMPRPFAFTVGGPGPSAPRGMNYKLPPDPGKQTTQVTGQVAAPVPQQMNAMMQGQPSGPVAMGYQQAPQVGQYPWQRAQSMQPVQQQMTVTQPQMPAPQPVSMQAPQQMPQAQPPIELYDEDIPF